MAKWTLPENRKPLTASDSADLVKKMHDKLAAGFTAGDRIARLEELYEAALEDAKEAEAYAEELEARLAKAVVFIQNFAFRAMIEEHDEDERDMIDFDSLRFERDCDIVQARSTLAELRGETDE